MRKLKTDYQVLAPKRLITYDQSIRNLELFVQRVGSVRTGINIIRSNNLTFGITSGDFIYYDTVTGTFPDPFQASGFAITPFRRYLPDGTIEPAVVTEIDPDIYFDGTNLANTPNNDWTQKPVAMNFTNGDVIVGYGQTVFTNNNLARDLSRDEELELPAVLKAANYSIIGAITVQEGQTNLNSGITYFRAADAFGQIKGLTNAGTVDTLLKDPVPNVAALALVGNPIEGEARQVLEFLPKVIFGVNNAGVWNLTPGVTVDERVQEINEAGVVQTTTGVLRIVLLNGGGAIAEIIASDGTQIPIG